jgi:hypothetical protein
VQRGGLTRPQHGFANALAVEHGIAAAAGGSLPGVKLFVALHVELLRNHMGTRDGNNRKKWGGPREVGHTRGHKQDR